MDIIRIAAAVAFAVASSATLARAHFSLEQGGTHMSRYGDGNDFIKNGPCGVDDGARGTHVYTYAPGEQITISIVEYISHSGYFRIAFDDDGDDDFADPASIAPANGRTCTSNPSDHCGEDDFFNNATVLMDNLEPHAQAFPNQPSYTWEVTLPDVECDNCTLQIIQVMTEAGKAPYDPSAPNANDLYYQCIDLVLQRDGGAGGSGGAGTGGTSADAGIAGSGAASGSGGGGGAMMPQAGEPAPPVTAGSTGQMPPDMAAGSGGALAPSAGTGVPMAGTSGQTAPPPGAGDTGGGCSAVRHANTGNGLSFAAALLVPLVMRRPRVRPLR